MDDLFYYEFMTELQESVDDEFFLEYKGDPTYFLRDNLQVPLITPKMAKPEFQKQIIQFVGEYLNTYSTKLQTAGPTHIVPFLDKETNFIYQSFGITKEETIAKMKEMKKIAYGADSSDNVLINCKNSPHKIILTSMLIDAYQHDYKDIIECSRYLFGLLDYAILFRSYWKLGVDEGTMNYTIENLPSNKFKAKKMNNIMELLKYDASASMDFFADKLKEGNDQIYIDFINRVRTQLNNTFRNLARFYYKNKELNLTQYSTDSHEEDGKLKEQEGKDTIMAEAIEKSCRKIATAELNNAIVRVVAQANELDINQLSNFLNQILNDKRNRLDQLIEFVIVAYFQSYPTAITIAGGEFLNFGLGLYRSLAGSKQQLYIDIRNILTLWTDEIIDIKKYYKGTTAISNYTRGIFNYFVFMISHFNN